MKRNGLLVLLVWFAACPASGQVLGNRVTADCSSVALNVEKSTITYICGMPHDKVVRLVDWRRRTVLVTARHC
jgi:hypothetical protein